MARLRVEVEFNLDVHIWLTRDCLGRSVRFMREQLDVELRLPPFDDGAPATITWDRLDFRGYAGVASGHGASEFPVRIAIDRFQVIIREEVAGISRADLEGPNAHTVPELISHDQQERMKSAEGISIEFLDRLRTRGQTWLGPTGTISYSVAPHAMTYEDQTNFRFVLGHGGTFVVPPRPASADLDLRTFEELAGPLASGSALPLPESILADADHFSGSSAVSVQIREGRQA